MVRSACCLKRPSCSDQNAWIWSSHACNATKCSARSEYTRPRASASTASTSTRPLARSTLRCRPIAGRDMPVTAASSLERRGPSRRTSMTRRRVGIRERGERDVDRVAEVIHHRVNHSPEARPGQGRRSRAWAGLERGVLAPAEEAPGLGAQQQHARRRRRRAPAPGSRGRSGCRCRSRSSRSTAAGGSAVGPPPRPAALPGRRTARRRRHRCRPSRRTQSSASWCCPRSSSCRRLAGLRRFRCRGLRRRGPEEPAGTTTLPATAAGAATDRAAAAATAAGRRRGRRRGSGSDEIAANVTSTVEYRAVRPRSGADRSS